MPHRPDSLSIATASPSRPASAAIAAAGSDLSVRIDAVLAARHGELLHGRAAGLGFSVLCDAALAQSPETPGTWRRGGACGHQWFVDRARGLSVVALTNTLYEGMSGRFVTDLRDAVYATAEVRA